MDILDKFVDNKLRIIVKPNSSKNEIVKWDSDKEAFRVNIKAKPEKGKANKEIVKFFRKLLGREVEIVSGLKSHNKILGIS